MDKEYLTAEEVGKFLGLKTNTVYVLALRHELPSFKFKRMRRFRLSDIQAWAEARRCSDDA